jgi:predicted nucleic acid-binding protein
MDDKRARQVAQAEALPLIGTVGVVLLGVRLRCLTTQQAQATLDQLYTGTAYISASLYREARQQLQSHER